MTWMKQCQRPLGGPLLWGGKHWWRFDLEGEVQKLEVEGSFSVTQGGSMDPEMKADHWSTRAVLTKDESEGV